MTSPITTHVLDLTTGQPARGVAVTLSSLDADGRWRVLARGVTDADGRVANLLAEGTPPAGSYCIHFETYEYFSGRGVAAFHPSIDVAFRVEGPSAHYHVPLLLSPFGYSTYRGS